MARLVSKLVKARSAPPLKVSAPAASPSAPSLETASVPPRSCQGVSAVVVPVSVQVLLPVFSKMLKFWYCEPIVEASNVSSSSPPSRKVSLAECAFATTLPKISEPACSSSVSAAGRSGDQLDGICLPVAGADRTAVDEV